MTTLPVRVVLFRVKMNIKYLSKALRIIKYIDVASKTERIRKNKLFSFQGHFTPCSFHSLKPEPAPIQSDLRHLIEPFSFVNSITAGAFPSPLDLPLYLSTKPAAYRGASKKTLLQYRSFSILLVSARQLQK